MPVLTHFIWREPARGGAGGVFMLIARRSAEEYPRSTRGAHLCSPTVSTHRYVGGLRHAAQCHRAHPYPRLPRGAALLQRATAGKGLPDRAPWAWSLSL